MTYGVVVPGSVEDLVGALDLKAQLALRTELRRLRNAADAMLALLFVADGTNPQVIEHGGDRGVTPMPLPPFVPSVPSAESLRCADLDEHVVVLHAVRVGRGWPALGIALVDADLAPPVLVDVVEDGGARIESVLVRALSRRR